VTEGPAGRATGGHDRTSRRAAVRLTLQVTAVIAAIVVALELVALAVVLNGQRSAEQQLLGDTLQSADDVSDPPAGVWLTIASGSRVQSTPGTPQGLPLADDLAKVASDGQPVTSRVSIDGRTYLVMTEQRQNAVVQAALDLSADEAARDRLVAALTVSGLLGLGLALVVGVLLARRAMRPLTTALVLQQRFVADASHELRAPLTLLSTRAQMARRDLDEGAPTARVRGELDGIVHDARSLSGVLEDLLAALDPRGSDGPLRVDVGRLAAEVVSASTATARASGIALRLDGGADPVEVRAPAAGLRRALVALVDNALRHARNEVVVSVRVDSGRCTVEVSDDGPGIDPDVMPVMFDRHAAAAGNGAGVRTYGLGLSLVQDLAARYGGTLDAVNRVDADGRPAGATLALTLPVTSPRGG
jgi:signal transduction histidine kinase